MGRVITTRQFKTYYEIYDKVVLKMLPFYGEMHKEMIRLVNRKKNEAFAVFEAGFGTGTLTYRMLKAFPMAEVYGIDNSAANIVKAEEKLEGFKNFAYQVGDFNKTKFDKKFDYLVSALAIHHLSGEEKARYFKKSFKALKAGGRIIIGDIVKSRDERLWHKYLVDKMGEEGEFRWQRHKSNKEDKPSTLAEQLRWLKEAGFNNVTYTKKWFNFYVFYGEKL